MLRRYTAIIAAAVALLGVTLVLVYEPVLLAVGDLVVIQDELRAADVIHVIAGRDHRTDYAIELYKRSYGKRIFFTGGWCRTIQGYHGQRGFKRAVAKGIPPQNISTDDSRVTSTYSEVVKLKEFIDKSQVPIHSVIVVSDPHHMRRARRTCRQVLGDRISLQMAPVPFELSPYQRRWWTHEKSRKMLKDKYLKLGYYCAQYRLSWGPAAAMIGLT